MLTSAVAWDTQQGRLVLSMPMQGHATSIHFKWVDSRGLVELHVVTGR